MLFISVSQKQSFSNILLIKRLWHRYFPENFAKFLKILFTGRLWATSSEQVTVYHYSACRQQNCSSVLVGELMKLFWGNYWQNPKIIAAVHYFHYNSHHHYHSHHFHYHWKMHLYHLNILLTILFIVIWSPICFNLSSFYLHIFH